MTEGEVLKPCPFCGEPLTIRAGVNGYGRCDTAECYIQQRALIVPFDDPRQVAQWNLRAAPPKEAEPWRPIETAPEKEELLVCVTHNLGDDEWETVQWVDFRIEGQGWVHYRNLIHVPFPPTHWRPLPSAPNQPETGQ